MKIFARYALASILLAGLALVLACGGDDDETPPGGASPTAVSSGGDGETVVYPAPDRELRGSAGANPAATNTPGGTGEDLHAEARDGD